LQIDFAVVKHVAHYTVYHGRTKSILGANVQSHSERLVLQWMLCLKITELVRLSTMCVKEGSPVNVTDALWLLQNC